MVSHSTFDCRCVKPRGIVCVLAIGMQWLENGQAMLNDTTPSDDTLASRVWTELSRATREREHAWRTPVLATLGADQSPQARTLVLRSADQQRGELRIFTDGRSPKVAELRAQPQVVLVFWSALLSWQLRVDVTMQVLDHGPDVDAAWERIARSAAARDYLGPAAPGQLMGGPAASAGSDDAHHLAVLVGSVRAMDWLALGPHGQHQRRWITPQGVQHLVP